MAALVFLALLVIGSAVLAFLGYHLGRSLFAFLTGYLAGWAGAYLFTKPRRHRGWVAVALGVCVLLPFFVSVFGLARGVEWMVLDFGFDSVGGTLWFGAVMGVAQVAFGRLSGVGFWAED